MKEKFEVYTTVLRFLTYKVTSNLVRIYLNVDLNNHSATLVSYYHDTPSDLDLELFDDICTDSKAHLPNLVVDGVTKTMKDFKEDNYDFLVYAIYEEITDDNK